MTRGGYLTVSFVLAQLLRFGHGARRPMHIAAFSAPSGQSYSISRTSTWCPDEQGHLHKVHREVQKRKFFDGEKWRSGSAVTEWEDGHQKSYHVLGDPELAKFVVPRSKLQRNLMGYVLGDPDHGHHDHFFDVESMLADMDLGHADSDREAASTEQETAGRKRALLQSMRGSASSALGKITGGVGRGWRKLKGAGGKLAVRVAGTKVGEAALARSPSDFHKSVAASVAASRYSGSCCGRNLMCDTEGDAYTSESKTLELTVSHDGKVQAKEKVSNFVGGKWEKFERILEPHVIEIWADKTRLLDATSMQAVPEALDAIDVEVESVKN